MKTKIFGIISTSTLLFLSGCNNDSNSVNPTQQTANLELNRTLTYLTEDIVLVDGKCWEQHVIAKEINGVTKYVAPDNIVGVIFSGENGVWTALSDCSQYINNSPINIEKIDKVTVDCYSMSLDECQAYPECRVLSVTEIAKIYNPTKYCQEYNQQLIFLGCIRTKNFDRNFITNVTMSHHTIFFNSELKTYIETYQNDVFITEYQDKSPYLAKWQVDKNATKNLWLYYEALGKENGKYYGSMLECNSSELKDIKF